MRVRSLLFGSWLATLGVSLFLTPAFIQADVVYPLGFFEMDMRSDQAPETNKLLHTILSVTTDFLNKAYWYTNDTTYQKVFCSIHNFTLGGSKTSLNDTKVDGNTSPYSAQISITGQVRFQDETKWTQSDVTDFNTQAFSVPAGPMSFLYSLMQYASQDSFLSNLTYAAVKVNGAVRDEDNIESDSTEEDQPPLEVWMIALIGGLGAFVVVLCVIITCICCIPIDEDNDKSKSRQIDVHGTNPTRSDSKMDEHLRFDELESKAPSPGKSIGSQDSSVFTYNPQSVRSHDSGRRSYNSYFTYGTQGIEMDISQYPESGVAGRHESRPSNTSTISATQISFGQDISAIEPKKGDLSLIEEDGETESSAAGSVSLRSEAVSPPQNVHNSVSPTPTFTNNTVHSSATSTRASGKYKSLLANVSSGSKSSEGPSTSIIAQKYLSDAAIQDREKQDQLDEMNTRGGRKSWSDKPESNLVSSLPAVSHSHSIQCRPSDEESRDSTSYGPRYYNPNISPQRRLNLGGSADEVMNDLQELSAQIDEIRASHSSATSISGRTAIRMRR